MVGVTGDFDSHEKRDLAGDFDGDVMDFDQFAFGDDDLGSGGDGPGATDGPRDGNRFDGGVESEHRGAFGEFGSTVEQGFLDRAFRERIVLVGVTTSGRTDAETEASLDELALLVDTAGADALERVVQKRDRPDPATFVGRGKVQDILDSSLAIDADTVVFDDELSPGQQVNLERMLKRTALDRTAVILDIFAQHATTAEGKAQVELAQLRYRLPRLRGRKDFSQQAGGIGTRGPGETQLEVDRRRLVRRMHKLERNLASISARRANQRKARRRSPYGTVSIVGYTNAGKSSLLRRLTGADVLVEDRLFATLDPTTRRLQLPGGEQILVTDTVGFVRKLPHQLVQAFRSTLEVAVGADLLVHVVDGSGPDPQAHIQAVREVLREIGANEIPELLVFNKADQAEDIDSLVRRHPGSVAVSALTGQGIDDFLQALGRQLRATTELYELFVPWARGDLLAATHREGQVISEESEEKGMRVMARLESASAQRLEAVIVARIPDSAA
ncbi:MAG: GTPase HflX [Acidimicrobiia bacterium]|nr:GTPase HflX [Acidimicrobiia bacterium]